MAKVLSTDYTSLYTRLNSVRSKFGLSTYSIPSISGKVLALQNNSLSSLMQSSYTDIKNRGYSSTIPVPNTFAVSAGTLLKYNSTVAIAQSNLTQWENTCANYSNHSDYGDYRDYNDDSDDSDNSNRSKYGSDWIAVGSYNEDNNTDGCSSQGGPSNYYNGSDHSDRSCRFN